MIRLMCAFALSFTLAACAVSPAPAPLQAATQAPPACLMIVAGTVTDRAAFRQYTAALPPLYARFGGAYLAVARNPEVLEGAIAYESLVASRWPSCDAARAFWNSPEYRVLVEMRAPWANFDVIITPMIPEGTTVAPMAQPQP